MQCTSKQMKFLNALRDYEVNKTIFSPQELADITGYSTNSVTKYINEKLNGIYVYSFGDKKFKCDGIGKLSNNDFALLMSQSLRAKRLTQDEILHKNLMKRSLDAFTLSLEVYNRPSLENRVEAFCIFAINAWELMLKAEIIKFLGAKAAFYDDKKSLTVRDAIKLRLNERDPVCHNLETLIELRDNAIHLLIPELQPELSRLFQANVLNYEQRYASEMGNSPFSGQSVGLLSLVIDSPLNEVALIKDNYGELTAEAASRFLEKFHKNAEELQSNEFSIPLDYKLVLTKKNKDGDLTLTTGADGKAGVIIYKPKDPTETHPHYETVAIEEINKRQKIKITKYSFRAVLSKHKIKEAQNELHWCIDKRHRYSQKFVEWFVSSMGQPNWLESSIEWYKKPKK